MKSSPAFRPQAYAIDFGTSNSLASAASVEEVHPAIPLDAKASDPTILRSILHFSDAGECHFGAAALTEYIAGDMQGRLLRSLKRFLPSPAFSKTLIGTRRYRLEDLIGAILRTIRERANRHFDCDVRKVVLGRPALFSDVEAEDDLAEQRLLAAAQLAGFEDVTFCPEPVAAAREFQTHLTSSKLILIADFGGGTSDFSVVRMGKNTFSKEDVLATGGVSVAGDALDGALMRGCLSRNFGAEVKYQVPMGRNVLTMPLPVMEMLCSPADLSLLRGRTLQNFLHDVRGWSLSDQDRTAMDRLLCLVEDSLGFQLFESIETTKRELSQNDSSEFRFEYPEIDLVQSVSRSEFERVCRPEIDKIIESLDATLQRAGVQVDQIDLVCLTGGTARVPRVSEALKTRFAAETMLPMRSLHAVSEGLAHHARLWLREH